MCKSLVVRLCACVAFSGPLGGVIPGRKQAGANAAFDGTDGVAEFPHWAIGALICILVRPLAGTAAGDSQGFRGQVRENR